MDRLKQFARYILIIIGIYVVSGFLIFIGFNVNYADINVKGDTPEQIIIKKAEATKHEGRVYGYISNSKDNNINGKYIKISVYDSMDELLTTEYLKINDVKYGEDKLFKSKFIADKISSCSISIVDQENV